MRRQLCVPRRDDHRGCVFVGRVVAEDTNWWDMDYVDRESPELVCNGDKPCAADSILIVSKAVQLIVY